MLAPAVAAAIYASRCVASSSSPCWGRSTTAALSALHPYLSGLTASTGHDSHTPGTGSSPSSSLPRREFSSSTASSSSSSSSSPTSPQASISQQQLLANGLSLPARSLAFERGSVRLPPALDNSMGHFLLSILGFYSHKSQILHGGQTLYDAIKEQCDDGALQRGFGMDPDVFFSTYTLLSLHVWLIIQRLGNKNDRDAKDFRQRFYQNFQNDIERRIHQSGVQVGVGKWLKKLETIFYSSGIAFDNVLSGASSETFTDVVLREYLGGEAAKRPQAALLAKYLQRELHCLQLTEDAAIYGGQVRFSREPFDPWRVKVSPSPNDGGTGPDKSKRKAVGVDRAPPAGGKGSRS